MQAEINATAIESVVKIKTHPFTDHRGTFLNAFRSQDDAFLISWGDREINQVNISRTENVGAIRGLHFQSPPYSEAKIVRCLKGKVWDVAVDLRIDSSTYGKWIAIELNSSQGNAFFIPEGCAHGFQVLESGSELLYLHSGEWVPEAEAGVRWDDPTLGIKWPLTVTDISPGDKALPSLNLL